MDQATNQGIPLMWHARYAEAKVLYWFSVLFLWSNAHFVMDQAGSLAIQGMFLVINARALVLNHSLVK